MPAVRNRSLLPLALLALAAAPLTAQPSVEAILARHAKAVDPEGKLASIEGMKMTATMEMPAMGMKASLVGIQRRPNQSFVTITLPGLGEMKQGYDGAVAWASDPMQGPRLMGGLEAATMLDGADMDAFTRPARLFASSEVVGEGEVDGEKCVKVKHTWKSSRVTTDCYSLTTGHVIESVGKQASPQGELEAVTRFSDFRADNGIVTARKAVVNVMGMQQILTTEAVEFGPQPQGAIEPPAEVKALKKP